MSSPDLGLPFIASQQAQPEVTHNTALMLLQALANGVIGVGSNTPPGSPVDGDAYIIGASPTGAWAGRANAVAIYLGGWFFLPDRNTAGTIIPIGARHQGLSAYNRADATMYRWSGTAWQSLTYATAADLAAHTGSTSAHDAANITFTPTTAADWSGGVDPGDVDNALDQLQAKASSKVTVNAASDADITLTAAQANAAVIDITDTGTVLTAARNVIVPARPGAFDFVNSTARALTVKTSAGTGAVVPKGARFPLLVGSANVRNPQMGSFIPFAYFPPASGNSGLVLGASDVGPAPGAELISDGTIWRPRGGQQVLWFRRLGNTTLRNLTKAVLETSPTFPAGLMQIGFALDATFRYQIPGIGTAARTFELRVGAVGSELTNMIQWTLTSTTSGATNEIRANSELAVQSTNGAQSRSAAGAIGFYGVSQPTEVATVVNFTAPWNIAFLGQSCAETAINITAASWAGGVATYTATAHTLAVGDVTVVAGATPSGYNGTFTVASAPDANTFTVAMAADPGVYVIGGTSSRTSNVRLLSFTVLLRG